MLFVLQVWHSSGDYTVADIYSTDDGQFNITSDNGVVQLGVSSAVKWNGAQLIYMGSTTGTHGISQLRHKFSRAHSTSDKKYMN